MTGTPRRLDPRTRFVSEESYDLAFPPHPATSNPLGYSPDVPKDDLRPAFDVRDAAFSAAGVREISFGNTFPMKARETQGSDKRTQKDGGWIGWALYRSASAATAQKSEPKN